jgi:nucleoside-diphosphate-sugar epimerase
MTVADVRRAAEDVDLIVHAVNPPGYRGWARLVLPMMANTIAAAEAVGARIVLPGTVYNFDPLTQKEVVEDSPQPGLSDKGAIRANLEGALESAASRGVRSLIVRAGDFFGPRVKQSWFAQAMVRPGKPVKRIVTPGREGAGHSWAYLPDLAEATAQLVDAEETLATFERVHFHGHWDHDGRQMTAAIARAAGHPRMGVWRFPWWATTLAAPFSETMREMREIRPYWENTLRISGGRLAALIGPEPHTPLDEAVRNTLIGLGCLDPRESSVAARS